MAFKTHVNMHVKTKNNNCCTTQANDRRKTQNSKENQKKNPKKQTKQTDNK